MKTTQKTQGIRRRDMPFAAQLRIRQTEDGGESRGIEGMSIVFDSVSAPLYSDGEIEIREKIAPEAVTDELLASSDILFTLYHDNTRILARSNKGVGTLNYQRTREGVRFWLDTPDTEDGRTALELVKRGEISGCSFAFTVDMGDPEAEERTVETDKNGKRIVTYTVKKIRTIHDFTLTPRPAYTDTSVGTRLRESQELREKKEARAYQEEVEKLRNLCDRY